MRMGVLAAMAACVMFRGGVAATLAFGNSSRLCVQVNVRHLVAGDCEMPRLLRGRIVELQGVSRVLMPSAVVAGRVAACPL